MRKNPRLQFTDAEQNPKLKGHVQSAEKAAGKAEAAQEKIPKVRKKVKRAALDPESGKITARLYFEEVDKVKPPSKLSHAVQDAPSNIVLWQCCHSKPCASPVWRGAEGRLP